MSSPEQRVALLVDDEDALGRIFQRIFEKKMEGWLVVIAGNCAEAREQMAVLGPELQILIIDKTLPDGDGIAFIAELAGDARARIKVILISGYGGITNEQSGADAFLEKPFGIQQLIEAVQELT